MVAEVAGWITCRLHTGALCCKMLPSGARISETRYGCISLPPFTTAQTAAAISRYEILLLCPKAQEASSTGPMRSAV